MPIPVIVAYIAYVLISAGVTAGTVGVIKIKKAKRLAEGANQRQRTATRNLDQKREEVTKRAGRYSRYLFRVNRETFKPMRSFLRQLNKNPKSKSLRLPNQIVLNTKTVRAFESKVLEPAQDFAKLVSALGAGGAAYGSAIGLASLFGIASTGTAISSLSGAAASNATIAWFGGGSLAAGGGGMYAGAVVLGGIALAPTIAITGFVVAGKGEKTLTQARAHVAKVNVQIEKLKTAQGFLDKVHDRIEELDALAKKLNRRTRRVLATLDADTFNRKSKEDLTNLSLALNLVTALSEVIGTPILSKSGKLTKSGSTIQVKYKDLAGETHG